jgi:hypothetical protein
MSYREVRDKRKRRKGRKSGHWSKRCGQVLVEDHFSDFGETRREKGGVEEEGKEEGSQMVTRMVEIIGI